MSQPTTGRFRTEWDTTPNPTYDIWTITNGGEVVPGVLRPFVASSFNRQDYESLVKLMGAYPTGHLVAVHKPPVGNFFGIVAGRIALNVGFTAAAMSVLDPQIAEAMLQQFFTGAGGTDRFIVRVPDEERAPAVAIAEAQRAAAPAQLAARQQALYAERGSAQPAADRALSLKQAWERHQVLTAEAVDGVNIHYVVSTAAGEWQVKLAGLLMMCGQDPAAVIALCSGLGEVESAKPAIALYDLAMTAARSETVATALNTQPAATVLESIRTAQSGAGQSLAGQSLVGQSGDASPGHDNDEWRAFADRFQEFLHLYGFRVQGEVDVSNADWSEQPTFVISQIRSMMAVPEGDSPRAQVAKAAAGREALEATIRGAIGPDMVPTFDAVLAQAQHFTRLRELSKATWVLDVRRGRSTYLALCDGISAVLGITPTTSTSS